MGRGFCAFPAREPPRCLAPARSSSTPTRRTAVPAASASLPGIAALSACSRRRCRRNRRCGCVVRRARARPRRGARSRRGGSAALLRWLQDGLLGSLPSRLWAAGLRRRRIVRRVARTWLRCLRRGCRTVRRGEKLPLFHAQRGAICAAEEEGVNRTAILAFSGSAPNLEKVGATKKTGKQKWSVRRPPQRVRSMEQGEASKL